MMSNDRDPRTAPGTLRDLQRFSDALAAGIARVSGVVCALALVAMAVGITVEIVSRNFFHYSFRSVEELSGYLIVAITFLGLAVAVYEQALFRVEFLLERFPARWRKGLDLLFLIAFAVFLGVIDYQSVELVIGSFRSGYVSSTLLATPLFIPQALIPLGVSATLLVVIARFLRVAMHDAGDELDSAQGKPEP